ncbi:endonuclease III [Natroniella sulfidigena]|uniref:endonuclease III n=1 Tax=Natroniella sulfidigena TaxID=723921 RepID=UPI002009E3AA|nr:endonuclease III [Natroniella sulfidigena]MCK8817807.1 endonuclease III [Natroniella sulfidigena]
MKELKSTEETCEILEILKEKYPAPETELNYNNPFELLIAVILSAQSTDKQVNKVTAQLFNKYQTPEDFANLTPEELATEIRGVGLYRNKSKYIIKTCQMLLDNYEGQIPQTRKELMKLSGVGRKTANVVASAVFGVDAIAVDTHVFRVSNRIGLAASDKVDQVEQDLMEVIPKDLWSDAHHWLIFHGRNLCKARNPNCSECPIIQYCDYAKSSKS